MALSNETNKVLAQVLHSSTKTITKADMAAAIIDMFNELMKRVEAAEITVVEPRFKVSCGIHRCAVTKMLTRTEASRGYYCEAHTSK